MSFYLFVDHQEIATGTGQPQAAVFCLERLWQNVDDHAADAKPQQRKTHESSATTDALGTYGSTPKSARPNTLAITFGWCMVDKGSTLSTMDQISKYAVAGTNPAPITSDAATCKP